MSIRIEKFLICVISLMLVFSFMPVISISAAADGEVTSGTWGGIDWSFDNGTLTISPTNGTPTIDPKTGQPYDVGVLRENVLYDSSGNATATGGSPIDAFKTRTYTLIIDHGVTHIGAWAFTGFSSLAGEVVIPSSVNYIGQESFQKCTMSKLTFAKGGGGELCIAQGAFKNLIVEEISLPSDRPVHIHAWTFLNSTNLKSVTLPASLTSVTGTHHHDWQKNPNGTNTGSLSDSKVINSTNTALEKITFGSESVRDLVCSNDNGYVKDFGTARIGLTYYKSLEAAANEATAGDTITLLKETDEERALPPGVLLDRNGFVAPNITLTPLPVANPDNVPVANPYNVPATSDSSNMPLWSGLFMAFLAVAVLTKKENLTSKRKTTS